MFYKKSLLFLYFSSAMFINPALAGEILFEQPSIDHIDNYLWLPGDCVPLISQRLCPLEIGQLLPKV